MLVCVGVLVIYDWESSRHKDKRLRNLFSHLLLNLDNVEFFGVIKTKQKKSINFLTWTGVRQTIDKIKIGYSDYNFFAEIQYNTLVNLSKIAFSGLINKIYFLNLHLMGND